MSIDEFVVRLNKTADDIERERPAEVLKLTLDTLALVKRRVINTGKDKDGKNFGKYSKAVVPYWFYYNKETNRNSASAVNQLLQRFGYFASYENWREVNNLQTEFINFSFTNRMWNSLAPSIDQNEEGRTVVVITAKTEDENKKVQYQNARFGDILALNKEERELLEQLNDQRIIDKFEQNGLL